MPDTGVERDDTPPPPPPPPERSHEVEALRDVPSWETREGDGGNGQALERPEPVALRDVPERLERQPRQAPPVDAEREIVADHAGPALDRADAVQAVDTETGAPTRDGPIDPEGPGGRGGVQPPANLEQAGPPPSDRPDEGSAPEDRVLTVSAPESGPDRPDALREIPGHEELEGAKASPDRLPDRVGEADGAWDPTRVRDRPEPDALREVVPARLDTPARQAPEVDAVREVPQARSSGTGAVEFDPVAADAKLIGPGDRLEPLKDAVPPLPGYYDVMVHGTPHDFWVGRGDQPGVNIDHRSLATFVRGQPDYNGEPVRLLSCSTGGGTATAAQNLSNKLGVQVLAPSDTLWVWPSGRLTIGDRPTSNDGEWRVFNPRRP